MRRIRLARRLVQCTVLAILIAVPILNLYRIHSVSGNLLAFDLAGFPFADPLAALQIFLATQSTPMRMCLGAGVVLGIALLLGPVFCGWLCPYGLLSEVVLKKRKTPQALPAKSPKKSIPLSMLTKGSIILIGLLASLFFLHAPILNQLSMPGWISRALQHYLLYREMLWGAGIVVLLLCIDALLQRRLWCRYICPQSFLLWAAGSLWPNRLRIFFIPRKCTCKPGDRPCHNACTLALDPRKKDVANRIQCINCGDCIDVCKQYGCALSYGLGKQKK